ncbi:MAG: 2,3,4,5-tetrahydropyridine-2,6-dicarboxylate N-succinyltransferase [Armatimonadota bacterium]
MSEGTLTVDNLKTKLEEYFTCSEEDLQKNKDMILAELKCFLNFLNSGEVRAVSKDGNDYKVNVWVKKAILLVFKLSGIKEIKVSNEIHFQDKELIIPNGNRFSGKQVRLVPNASYVREGSYIGKNCVLMSPSYVNIGAYVDDSSMIDSNALIGSCAQIGKKVHVSAGAYIGGVLEPVGGLPVIVEDGVLIGGNCGIYEGAIIEKGAVIASGVILTSGTAVYDMVKKKVYKASPGVPLRIPAGAIVVSGARGIEGDFAKEHNLSIYTPIIVKYKDQKTEEKVKIEQNLR